MKQESVHSEILSEKASQNHNNISKRLINEHGDVVLKRFQAVLNSDRVITGYRGVNVDNGELHGNFGGALCASVCTDSCFTREGAKALTADFQHAFVQRGFACPPSVQTNQDTSQGIQLDPTQSRTSSASLERSSALNTLANLLTCASLA